MSILNTGFSALGKLITVVLLLGAFVVGMAGVVYMSLTGEEIKVPEITGKDFSESEKELASLGLKIKKRADRLSPEKMNTVLEQLPKAGDTVKTGQMILVVVSKAGIEGDETPKSLLKDLEADDTKKIEEMISDKPKKPKTVSNSNSNSNTKKKADTTRDVIDNTNPDGKTDANSKSGDTNKSEPGANKENKGDKGKDGPNGTTPKPQNTPAKPASSEKRPTMKNRP